MTPHKTATTLADGRELIYFDLGAGARRRWTDTRTLPPVSTTAQMRWDPLLEEWVMMASHRQDRTFLPPADECPLCPSADGRRTEIAADDYDVVVFENRFPSLSTGAVLDGKVLDGTALDSTALDGAAGDHPLVDVRPAIGRCEVICFSSDHSRRFADLSPSHARLVVDVWADRTLALSRVKGVEQVFCFESRGEEIGVTLSHPHGQIYAYPFTTPRTARMFQAAARHRRRTGGDLHTDVLDAERRSGVRVVAENEHWAAFVPAAARWPLEVHLYPRRRVKTIPDLDDAERDALATIYLDLLTRLDRLYGKPLPYISAWHQAPVDDPDDLAYLHLQLFSIRRSADKLKYLAGSESGMGAFVTDTLPEQVARRLREV
ncbi:UDPglucose--hexose-1-phosphate uridylyltransferase [Actinomadura madurae]|uniref:Galactose-1-phosphate uridylyltransferase n=1 Tax=Actinomadura madurae TaxID=1993 RepID=A0A1I5KJ61_9ACTN|nr:galactose-1-phosphate uridylyltransferase [Actinomadura madurae]SFO85100.1 UDPglucose--hexose-1-phosphate uridylyltransferase [Actinomadura madurae]